MPGSTTSVVEVTHISKHGFWRLLGDEELHLPFELFPWFRHATVDQITTVELPAPGHLYWLALDLDLSVQSIRQPADFSMVARVRANLVPMTHVSVAELLELPVQERIHLVELIWESIAAVPHAVEVSEDLKAELQTRLRSFECDPEAGYSWNDVKEKLKNGAWRTA